MNTEELEKILQNYIKIQTFPIAFKLVKDEKEVPEKVRRFKNLAICQIYNISRRYGWTTYFDKNTSCPLGIIAYNFCDPDEYWKTGKLAKEAGYAENEAVGIEFEKVVPRIEERYEGCIVAPLSRVKDPDFVVVYGSPAQILRLVHATLFSKGGCLETCILGRAACAEYLEAYIKKKPKFVVPCYGDRLFGLTQDWEVSFSFPFSLAEEIARGLEETHKRGIRYPVPCTALRVELPMIESTKNL